MDKCELVVMGASMGGLNALETVLKFLPSTFTAPVAVVLHRSVDSTDGLVNVLRKVSRLKIREPLDKEPIQPGHVYIAAADYHLLVDGCSFALSTGAPELFARPSIDVLFESAAECYGSKLAAIIMTGASTDGTRGVEAVDAAGGTVIIQDPATADSPLMPRSALNAVTTDYLLSLPEIGRCLPVICGELESSADCAIKANTHAT